MAGTRLKPGGRGKLPGQILLVLSPDRPCNKMRLHGFMEDRKNLFGG